MYHQMNSDANGSSLLQTMSVSMSFPTQKQRDEAYSAGPHVASNGAALRGSTGSISNGIAGALFSLHNRQNGGALVGSQPYGGMSGSMPQEDKSLAPVFQSLDHQPQHMTIYDQRPTPLSSPRQQQGGSYPSLMEKHAHASVAIPVSADMTQFDPSAALPALDVSSAFIPMGDGGADFSSARAAPKATGAHVSPRTASPHTSPRTQAKNTKVKVEGSPTSTADAESLSPTSANLIGSQIFVCSFAGCGKEFSSRYSHRRHMKNHTGERPHVCPFDNCESKFAERSTLVRHIRVHTGEKPYKCSFIGCNRAFADRTNVKRHLLTHTGTKPYPCTYPDCNRSYSRKCYLTKHMVSVHNYTKPENCSDHDSDSDDGGSDDSDFDEPEDGGARGGSLLSGSAAAAASCLL